MYSGGNDTGLDGFSLDIQRGRDHGLPGYVEYRKLFGLNYSGFDKLSDTIPSSVSVHSSYNEDMGLFHLKPYYLINIDIFRL
jgi:hypothetical protein